MDLYPVFLQLKSRSVLVVGGGKVAAAKLEALLAAGARVTVVAPSILDSIRRPDVQVEEREFVPADLEGKWFVVAAAPPEVNRTVAGAAEERALFVNAVDDVFGHCLRWNVKDRRLIHVIPEAGYAHLVEVAIEAAPPVPRLRSREVWKNAGARPYDS